MTAAVVLPVSDRAAGRVLPVAGRAYLHPGQYAVADAPCTMTTILGSCVGACLHDPVAGVGGLNHFLLPRAPSGESSARWGDVAMARLVRDLVRLGAEPGRLVATVVGGACVLDVYRDRSGGLGRENVAVALAALGALGVRAVAGDVLGYRGRRVTFDPHRGSIHVRTL